MNNSGSRGRSSLWLTLFLINSFIYVALAVTGPYLNVYYSSMGITPSKIGILSAIGSFSGLLIQPVWASISDRTGRKKDIYSLVVAGCVLVPLTYYLGKTFGFFVIVAFLHSLFNSSVIPLGDALVTGQANKHGFEFSRIRLGGTLFYALTVYLIGQFLTDHPASMFMFSSGAYLCLLILVRLLPKNVNEKGLKARREEAALEAAKEETAATAEPRRISAAPAKGLLSIYKSKEILFIIAFALINQIGLIFYQAYFGVYIQSMGYTQAEIGFMNSISALSEVPVLLLIAWFMKKFGTAKLMGFACVMMSLRIFLVPTENYAIMAVSQCMHGVTYMICHYCSAVYISKNVVPGNEAKGMSIYAVSQTVLGALLGNVCGGFLCQDLGYKNAYYTMSGILISVTVVTIVLYITLKKKLVPAAEA